MVVFLCVCSWCFRCFSRVLEGLFLFLVYTCGVSIAVVGLVLSLVFAPLGVHPFGPLKRHLASEGVSVFLLGVSNEVQRIMAWKEFRRSPSEAEVLEHSYYARPKEREAKVDLGGIKSLLLAAVCVFFAC